MISERYRYNERIHSGVDFSNAQEVAVYDSYMQKLRNMEPEIEKVKSIVRLGSSDVVLDVGAGTGALAIGLAKHCKQVFAIDVSKAMIDYAEQKASEQENIPIVFSHAGFLTFLLPPETLDVVVSQFALHHLPDFWKSIALKRIFAAMRPGGRFFLQDCVLPSTVDDYDKYFAEVVSRIETTGGEKVAKDTEKTFRDEFVTLDWIMTELLEKAGFRIISREYSVPFINTYLCLK